MLIGGQISGWGSFICWSMVSDPFELLLSSLEAIDPVLAASSITVLVGIILMKVSFFGYVIYYTKVLHFTWHQVRIRKSTELSRKINPNNR